ncbi:MAG: hypothetical protein EOP92_22820 [Lysobacteraceae bacterium]|nr:MAG: hypothetical protein EOP92_22820 [Xanthomonadaceae bacterium]
MWRSLLGIVVGAVVMWLVVAGIQFASHVIYPPPAGLDPMQPADLERILAASPVGALALVVVAWTLGAFAGGWVAARIARHPRVAAVLVALGVMAGVAGMIAAMPGHPMWMSVLGLVLPVPAALIAAKLAQPRVRVP